MTTTGDTTEIRAVLRLPDCELVTRFADAADEGAFGELLRRHGPMVLGVCRRILRNESDADDAFQATFLVLVRKAGSIEPPGLVGNWLYGVAYNTALKARAMSQKRLARENAVVPRTPPTDAGMSWEEIRPILDQELNALPDKYRAPVLLCDIEGKSLKDAAGHLGWPLGTVGTRVARGRQMLRRRLARHGVTPTLVALPLLLTENAASAAVPAQLASSTVQSAAIVMHAPANAALAVSKSVLLLYLAALRSLLLRRVSVLATWLLVAAAVGAAATSVVYWQISPSASKTGGTTKPQYHRLHGEWALISVTQGGRMLAPEEFRQHANWAFDCDKLLVTTSGKASGRFAADSINSPNELELWMTGGDRAVFPLRALGIYELELRTLRIGLPGPGTHWNERPKSLQSQPGDHPITVLEFQRVNRNKSRAAS
ncbi:MAG: sigma-70 family RNA polymerase sigma factor [Gemmataceae bacterium]|nr:sigma-70 family RNA polymerase sigma factor [Gemmataceae bacterium]